MGRFLYCPGRPNKTCRKKIWASFNLSGFIPGEPDKTHHSLSWFKAKLGPLSGLQRATWRHSSINRSQIYIFDPVESLNSTLTLAIFNKTEHDPLNNPPAPAPGKLSVQLQNSKSSLYTPHSWTKRKSDARQRNNSRLWNILATLSLDKG